MSLKECRELYNKLDENKKQKAIEFLRKSFDDIEKEVFKVWIERNPDDWFAKEMWHFSGGMVVRNLLRENSMGEKFFGIDNLDDIYFLCRDFNL